MGLELSNTSKSLWVPAALFCAVLSLVLGIWIGPHGVYASSFAGLLFALVALMRRLRQPSFLAGRGVPIVLLSTHVLFLLVGIVLEALFLRPLSDASLQMPHLTKRYSTPDSFFDVRGPAGWIAENIHAPTEAGIRLRPSEREQYMGISELTVRVRELESPEVSRPGFLKKMAETFSNNRKEGPSKLFNFSTRPAKLLSGGEGLWSDLVVKRFWVPLYQISLFGIKNKRYLCSVSATGLKSHATLSEVMCLGVFETIRVKPLQSARFTDTIDS